MSVLRLFKNEKILKFLKFSKIGKIHIFLKNCRHIYVRIHAYCADMPHKTERGDKRNDNSSSRTKSLKVVFQKVKKKNIFLKFSNNRSTGFLKKKISHMFMKKDKSNCFK